MTRFCTKCGGVIADEKRVRRGSPYCSDECRREAKRETRALLAQRRCRLCGRVMRPKETEGRASSPCAPGAHAPIERTATHQF